MTNRVEIKEAIDRLRTLKELAEERLLMFREKTLGTENLPSGTDTTEESIRNDEEYIRQLNADIEALKRELE
jgi:hypothetical protein